MKKKQISAKIKAHQKATESIVRLTLERKNLRCRKCKKKISFTKKEMKCFIDGFQWSKKMKGSMSWSAIPIQIMSPLFIHEPFHILCHKCKNDVYRFMGMIPDKHDHEVFPSKTTMMPEGADVGDWIMSKTKDWTTTYKKIQEPYNKKKYMKYLKEACKAYKKKYPYIPYTEKKLLDVVEKYGFRDNWL